MFRIIGATVVYGLAIVGLAKVLKGVRLRRDVEAPPRRQG